MTVAQHPKGKTFQWNLNSSNSISRALWSAFRRKNMFYICYFAIYFQQTTIYWKSTMCLKTWVDDDNIKQILYDVS